MTLLTASPLLFSSEISFPLSLNPYPLESMCLAKASLILFNLSVVARVAYLFVEETGDKIVQIASIFLFLLIIPCVRVNIVSRNKFEVIHQLECDFRDGFFLFCQVQVLTIMERVYGI